MSQQNIRRVIVPAVVLVVALLAVVVLAGLASQNPDGFEWAVFDFAAIPEPEEGFPGVWAFLGEGPLVDFVTGATGVLVALVLAYVLFWATSRKSE